MRLSLAGFSLRSCTAGLKICTGQYLTDWLDLTNLWIFWEKEFLHLLYADWLTTHLVSEPKTSNHRLGENKLGFYVKVKVICAHSMSLTLVPYSVLDKAGSRRCVANIIDNKYMR